MDGKLNGVILTGADLSGAYLAYTDLTNATYDSTTTWPPVGFWGDTTCPDGTNSGDVGNAAGNATCGF